MYALDFLGDCRLVAMDGILYELHACRDARDGLGSVHFPYRLLELAADLLVRDARRLALLVVRQVAQVDEQSEDVAARGVSATRPRIA